MPLFIHRGYSNAIPTLHYTEGTLKAFSNEIKVSGQRATYTDMS